PALSLLLLTTMMTAHIKAMCTDRESGYPERGVERSTPRLLSVRRGFHGQPFLRRCLQLICSLALLSGSGVAGAAAGTVRAAHLRVTADSFGLGSMTVACELKNMSGSALSGGRAESLEVTPISSPRIRYKFR